MDRHAKAALFDGRSLVTRQIASYRKCVPDYAQLLVDSSLDMIISVDLLLRIVEFNPAAEIAFGYKRDEVVGQSVEMLYADPNEAWRIRTSSLDEGFSGEVRNRRKNGEVFYSYLRSVGLRNESGEIIGAMGFSRDITVEKKCLAELRQAREAAEAATQAKSQFVANVSHEIRTPMTAILGFVDLLANAEAPETERRSAIQIIRRNGEHLLGIVNDILDLSKIESGKMQLERNACSPHEVVNDVAALMQVRAQARQLALRVQWDGPIPETIVTDVTRLRQVLINLVANAVKFTSAGEVRITTRMTAGPADSGASLEFEIADTGIGLTAEQLQRVFEPFTQADNSTTRRYGGTGLGLSICRHLVHMLGGELTAESVPDRGSTFRFSIPTGGLGGVRLVTSASTEIRPEAGRSPSTELPAGCRILLAEDGPDNQRLFGALLTKAGVDLRIVENGQAAVEAIMESELAERPFDVVLMDIQMPVMDGHEAVRQLRDKSCDVPIVALTANGVADERAFCLANGYDDFAAKPIDSVKLLTIIRRNLDRRPADTRRAKSLPLAAAPRHQTRASPAVRTEPAT